MELNPFSRPSTHGFARVAVGVPRVRVGDPEFNAHETVALLQEAERGGVDLVVFPELGLSAYTCDDLFHQRALLAACEAALVRVVEASRGLATVAVVGLPLVVDNALYNCAAVVQRGRLLGIVPKSYLPNYGEFYEARQFQPAAHASAAQASVGGLVAPFGTHLLFQAAGDPRFTLHVEICEDLWVPIPPSSLAALAGATVLANLSASNVTIGKADYRRALVQSQSARCIAAYLYGSAGNGESSTDLAWDGQALIGENGTLLRESERFSTQPHLIVADVDLERLGHERMRQTSFGATAARFRRDVQAFVRVPFEAPGRGAAPLLRDVARYPYVPADARRRDERCREVYDIQVQALAQRLEASGIRKLVIGVSGGLDSTQALLVAALAMDRIGLPRHHIVGVTMPGYATSRRTLDQALRLMQSIGCEARQVDIRPSCDQMLRDIGHPAARGERVHDVTFENVQAGERTSHLFRIANQENAFVLGTGDLSELALGWCTYGVGDHMSHYNVNASVPKTLIRHLVRWVADSGRLGDAGSAVLHDVLDTVVSPELVPDEAGDDAAPSQSTEDRLGPYALHDFFLFHIVRYGYAPSKVAFLAWCAWRDAAEGAWPEGTEGERRAYALADIKRHLRTFVDRFFRTSQFKRSCVPNAPKVGSGGSLSPRGDWRAPSDSQAAAWLADVDAIPDSEPTA